MIVLTFLGPEYLGHKFSVAFDRDMVEASGEAAIAAILPEAAVLHRDGHAHVADHDSSDDGHGVDKGHF